MVDRRQTHVDSMWPLSKDARGALVGCSSQSRTQIGPDSNGWKSCDEKKVLEVSERGSGMIKGGKNFMPHFLEIQLRDWVCYKLVSEQQQHLACLAHA
jgi:hypothetical protein